MFAANTITFDHSCSVSRHSNSNGLQDDIDVVMPQQAQRASSPASDPVLLCWGVQVGDEDAASFTGEGHMHMPGREGIEMRGSLRALPCGGVAGGSRGLDP